jgi:demethylmenaquinone methyltransferase/2-methoxy-6-polyprenyl-1,4-benzoquinol methylase
MPGINRVTRSHAQARASYDRLSRWYDFFEGGWETRPRRLGLDLLKVKPGEKVLEIGIGTGSSQLELPEQVCPVGLDLSFKMLKQARAHLENSDKPVRLVQGDALSLPFPSGCFSSAFMAFTLELMDTPEISIVLGELRRVLKLGGRLGVVSLSKLGGIGLMQHLYEWSHAILPAVVDCRPIYARRALEQAGFTILDYRLISLTGLGIEVSLGRVEKKLP